MYCLLCNSKQKIFDQGRDNEMNKENPNHISYYCEKCSINNEEDCGPWNVNEDCFQSAKQIHQSHPRWKRGEPHKVSSQDGFNDIIQLVVTKFDEAKEVTKQREQERGTPIKQIEDYLDSIIKNDEHLVSKLIRVFFSAKSNNPINLAILSPTSEGKTYATVEASKIFPREDVISVGRLSPTALIHQRGVLVDSNLIPIQDQLIQLDYESSHDKSHKKELKKQKLDLLNGAKNLIDLSGKILLFLDAPNIKLWDALKPILSHDKYEIEYKTTQTDGSLRVKESIIRGWPAVVFCSAKNEAHDRLWDEIETRFDIISPNTDVIKYKEANKFTSLKMGIPEFAGGLVSNQEDEKYARFYVKKINETISGLCKHNHNPVWNPFNQIMADSFPSNEGVSMRHYTRLMSYCNIETLINADINYKIIFETKDKELQQYIITSLKDIESAISILGNVSVIPPDKIKFLNDIFEPCLKETLEEGVASNKLAEKYKNAYQKNITPKKILENFLTPLCDYGILDFTKNPDDMRQNLYRISSAPCINRVEFILNSIIEESNNNPLFVWDGIIELERCSIEKGKIKCILDPYGYPEGHNLIQKNIVKTTNESNILRCIQA